MPTTAIIPLKPTLRAKSRLLLDADTRFALANAFARDLIAECLACPEIDDCLVVGTAPSDSTVRQITDPGAGLNQALHTAAAELASTDSIILLMGDLPCVRSVDLSQALADWQESSPDGSTGAFVSDLAGVGTTTVLTRNDAVQPRFGPRSRARHRDSGLVELTQPHLARMRRDVDSLVDLTDALRIGVGPHTQDCVSSLGLTV